MKHLVNIASLSKNEILDILDTAKTLSNNPEPSLLQGKTIASCFFEASTRTRLSFEAAVYRLGGTVIGFDQADTTSLGQKGESLEDSVRVISGYADAIIIRHPSMGSADIAAKNASVPVINAGDGSNQHPTQTLLDLYTIQSCQGKLDNLSIAFVGDLKYSRTVHSLASACTLFNAELHLVPSKYLNMPEPICDYLQEKGIKYTVHNDISDVIDLVDILYLTRIQKERLTPGEASAISENCILKPELLEHVKPNFKILHPLPRREELPNAIDETPYAYYFQQAHNGVLVREAILKTLLK